jgi:hypothetical protein
LTEPVEGKAEISRSRKFRQSNFGSLSTDHIIIS